ncbi:MAG: GFA family protein [Myxococcota bacterium]|nr:GFA family protein [Myxococcota bacterium]
MIRGSCLCGGFQFEIDGRVSDLHRCHCSVCRKATGAGGIAVLATATKSLRWISGPEGIREFQRESGWSAAFCPTCGTPAPRQHPNGKIWSIPAGCLDDDPGTRVAEHIFVGSIASWDAVSGGGAEYDEWGPEHESS